MIAQISCRKRMPRHSHIQRTRNVVIVKKMVVIIPEPSHHRGVGAGLSHGLNFLHVVLQVHQLDQKINRPSQQVGLGHQLYRGVAAVRDWGCKVCCQIRRRIRRKYLVHA